MPRATRGLAFAVGLSLLTSARVSAQTGTVQGRVTDSSGVAVVQASVIVEPAGPRTYSNDRGDYVLRGVPAGSYTMRVRRIGYDAGPIAITVIDGQTLQLPVVMRRLAVTLASVNVVVGSRARHTAADELAVSVDIFTAAEIRQTGTTETAQVLQQLAPSVNFPRQSVSDATEIVRPFTMRGLSPDHSLVLLNGKRRHRTALIHYYGAGQGAGSSGVDMNAIPRARSTGSKCCATAPPRSTGRTRSPASSTSS